MKILQLIKKITSAVEFKDILIFIGIIMAARGIYMVYPPAMWLSVGVFLIYLGWPKAKAVK